MLSLPETGPRALGSLSDLRDEDERAEQGETGQQRGDVGDQDGRAGEHRHIHQRLLDPPLEQAEKHQDDDAACNEAEGAGADPAPLGGLG
jgi:hypothetical protein